MSDENQCIETTTRNERCKAKIFKHKICIRHYNLRKKRGLKSYKGQVKECSNSGHNYRGSKYLKDKVPIEKFYKVSKSPTDLFSTCEDCRNQKFGIKPTLNESIDENDEEEILDPFIDEIEQNDGTCIHITTKQKRCSRPAAINKLCKYHHNFILKKEGKYIVEIPEDHIETSICSCPSHKSYGSKYPKDKVPKELFLKNDNSNEYYLTCEDCRKYSRTMIENRRIRLSELVTKGDIDKFKVCCSVNHDIKGLSIYPRESVPISLFSYKSKDSKKLSKCCINCREYTNEKNKLYSQKIIENAENKGQFYCGSCHNILNSSHRAINKDGTYSIHCIVCKEKKKEYADIHLKRMKNVFRTIQKEFMERNECSCERCKSIFIKPNNDIKYVIELQTYEENDLRYVNYNGDKYLCKDFLKEFHDLLEFRILEFDHLDKDEQIERGIINEGDEFIEKKDRVSGLQSEYDMRKESEITQLLCCKCHLIVTIEREFKNSKTGIIREHGNHEKIEYLYNLKKESKCAVCEFSDVNLLRYLEFDHIDPENKILCISDMKQNYKYTLQELIDECNKCRILCKSCHKLHTDEQRQQGIIKYK